MGQWHLRGGRMWLCMGKLWRGHRSPPSPQPLRWHPLCSCWYHCQLCYGARKCTCTSPLFSLWPAEEKMCICSANHFLCCVSLALDMEMIPFDHGKGGHSSLLSSSQWCCVGHDAGLKRKGAFAILSLSLQRLCTWIWNDWFGWTVHVQWIFLSRKVCLWQRDKESIRIFSIDFLN